MDLEEMKKDQLQDEASKRGLPVSGTNPELIERIRTYDADPDNLLGGDGGGPSTGGGSAPQAPSEPEKPRLTIFTAKYECPGELSTGVHQENVRRCWNDAQQAGYEPRGGAFAAGRTGFVVEGGKRYAVYTIPVRS